MKAVTSSDVYLDMRSEDPDVDLREYIYVLSSYKWSILGLTLILTLLAAFYVHTLQPVYRATATVLIETQKENVVSIEEVYGFQGAFYEYYQTQLELMKSRELAERVIDRLKLAEHPGFNPGIAGQDAENGSAVPVSWKTQIKKSIKSLFPAEWFPTPPPQLPAKVQNRNALTGTFIGMLDVRFVPDTQLINISFDSHDPELAARLANTLAEVYIESGLESRLETTRKASEWITAQLEELKQKVVESEQALQAYLDQEQLVNAKGVDGIALQELNDITAKLVEAGAKRSEAGELFRQITALEGQPVEAYASIPAVLQDPQVHQAKGAQADAARKVSELAKRYGPKHPKMIAANAELATAENNLNRQILNVVESVKKQYSVANAEESHLSGILKNTKNQIADINRKSYKLQLLEKDVQSNRQLYEMFLTRFKETTATDDLQTPNARVVDYAATPSGPYKPNKQKFIFIAFIAAFLISLMLVFLIEKLDNTLSDSGEVENKLFLPVLSILPIISTWLTRGGRALRHFSEKKHSNFSENIRTIRTSVLLSDIDVQNKSILITSSVAGEGKSILAVNLSLALAQMGKAVLIDADMRKPTVAKIFELDKSAPGLSHFITGAHDLKDCLHYFPEEKLHVMPAGQVPSNPLELLSSLRFEKGLATLKQQFDYVIIDGAPSVPVSDPIVLSRLVNATIYVVKANDTPFQIARTGIRKLQQVNSKILGIVLNQVAASKRPGRYGYGESDYYSYYGYHHKP